MRFASSSEGCGLSKHGSTVTISDLGRVVTGRTPPGALPEDFGGDVPFVTPSDMDGRRVIERTLRNLSPHGLGSVVSATIPCGSVMVSCIGSDMGKVAIAGANSVTNQQINSIIVREDIADPMFVYYALLARRAEFRQLAAGGSAQPILNKKTFSSLPIALPSLPRQRAVATTLGVFDEKIELNRRICLTLEQIGEAVFRSRFIDFDGADDLVDSEIGMIPRAWRVVELREVVQLVKDTAPAGTRDDHSPYIGLDVMPRGSTVLSAWGERSSVSGTTSRFKAGDILFGKLRPYFKKVGVAPVDGSNRSGRPSGNCQGTCRWARRATRKAGVFSQRRLWSRSPTSRRRRVEAIIAARGGCLRLPSALMSRLSGYGSSLPRP